MEQDWASQVERINVAVQECPGCGCGLTKDDLARGECENCGFGDANNYKEEDVQ